MSSSYTRPHILIETGSLEARLHDPILRIIDCTVRMRPQRGGGVIVEKGRDGWNLGHIPGADFIDLAEELAAPHPKLPFMMPDADQFARVLGAHGIGNEHNVVIYAAGNPAWATRLFLMLRAMGHDRAQVLNGGWEKWNLEQRPVSREAPRHPPARFVPHPRGGHFLNKSDILARLGKHDVCLVHALSSDVFHGRTVQFERPGRIPGSTNVPATELIDPTTKCFLPVAQLRERLSKALAANRTITYCGGGISATIDAFAMLLLGYDEVAVYDGSLTEWTSDPELPMELP